MTATDTATQTGSSEFRMPSLGADMRAGTVVAWLVKPGDSVKRGDVVAEVETEKGVFEVEISSEGIVAEICVAKGAKVPVGTVLARLHGSGFAAPPAPALPARAVPSPAQPGGAVPTPRAPVRASPLARKIAESAGINLEGIVGSGPSGAITKADVERLIEQREKPLVPQVAEMPPSTAATPTPTPTPTPAPTPAATSDATLAMRHAVATAVARSKREIPHYYLGTDVNLGAAMRWLAARNASRPVTDRVLPAVLLLKSVAVALRASPSLNGFWIDETFRAAERVHLGVAISLRGGGLIAPAIHDADRLSIDDLMRALRDLVRRARSGGLRSSEMTDATVTVSNLGDEGATAVYGIIYPPQVALVGFGGIAERPWADNGMLGVRPIVTVTLAADHRATDGHYGGRFLGEVNRLLQTPESL
jgi:pyruvate dehydrogenase E2 component (dihydrolipoamide acetyltransferase)